MSVIKIGDTTAQPIASEAEFDPITGPRVREVWEGSEEDLLAQAQLFMASGLRAEVYPYQGPLYRMRVYVPDDQGGAQPFFDTWERITDVAQEDIRYNPKLIASVLETVTLLPTTSPSSFINKLYREFKEKVRKGEEVSYGEGTAMQAFFDLIARGSEAHELRRPVLRRRRLLHLNKLAQSEVLAVERIFSTAKLREIFQIPDAIGAKLPIAGATTPSNTLWGWKERSDTSVATPALYKVEETKEFVFSAWSTVLYDHVT